MDSLDKMGATGKPFILPLLLSIAVTFGLLFSMPTPRADIEEGYAVASSSLTEGRAVAEAVARELLAGTTEGRQALVGSIWYAPLPSLASLAFATFTPPSANAIAAWYASLLALVLSVTLFARRFMPRAMSRRTAGPPEQATEPPRPECENIIAVAFGFIKPLFIIPIAAVLVWIFSARLNFDPYLTLPAAATIAATVKFADWLRSKLLRDWVKFAFAFATLSFCGIRGFIPAAVLAAAAFAGIIARKFSRERLGGLTFLFLSPFIYGLAIWTLMSFLIFDDFAFPIRGFDKGIFTTNCEKTSEETGVLQSAFKYIDRQTKYGRLFVCGYNGLAQTITLNDDEKRKAEPCIDLHIDVIRKAYVKQNIFFLVHKPVGPALLDSSSWRLPELYAEGHERLLFCADYGNWRLFELIVAQPD